MDTVRVMELLLIRHAQPAWVVDGIGYNDPDLSELGRAQAVAVGAALAEVAVDEFWVSPAARSQQTAAAITAHHDAPVTTLDWALEIQLPDDWNEVPVETIRTWFQESRSHDREQWWQASGPHGGETFRHFHQRVASGLEAELAGRDITRVPDTPDLWRVPDDDTRRVALVTHAGTNSVVLGTLLGVAPQPWEWERFSSAHASVTILRNRAIASADIFGLRSFSETAHLAAADLEVTR